MTRYARWLLLLILAVPALYVSGAPYEPWWRVGEIADKAAALRQARRISAAAGIEVWLDSGDGHAFRLLIRTFADEEDRARLRMQLREAGVDNPVPVSLEDGTTGMQSVFSVVGETASNAPSGSLPARVEMTPSSAAAGASGYLVVVASFTKREGALERRAELAKSFDDVQVLEADVTGQHYYRVAIGPVTGAARDAVVGKLRAAGVKNSWAVPYTGKELAEAADEPDKVKAPAVVTPNQAQKTLPENGYNPARLRRRPNPFFQRDE